MVNAELERVVDPAAAMLTSMQGGLYSHQKGPHVGGSTERGVPCRGGSTDDKDDGELVSAAGYGRAAAGEICAACEASNSKSVDNHITMHSPPAIPGVHAGTQGGHEEYSTSNPMSSPCSLSSSPPHTSSSPPHTSRHAEGKTAADAWDTAMHAELSSGALTDGSLTDDTLTDEALTDMHGQWNMHHEHTNAAPMMCGDQHLYSQHHAHGSSTSAAAAAAAGAEGGCCMDEEEFHSAHESDMEDTDTDVHVHNNMDNMCDHQTCSRTHTSASVPQQTSVPQHTAHHPHTTTSTATAPAHSTKHAPMGLRHRLLLKLHNTGGHGEPAQPQATATAPEVARPLFAALDEYDHAFAKRAESPVPGSPVSSTGLATPPALRLRLTKGDEEGSACKSKLGGVQGGVVLVARGNELQASMKLFSLPYISE